jgi:hypothetical protein
MAMHLPKNLLAKLWPSFNSQKGTNSTTKAYYGSFMYNKGSDISCSQHEKLWTCHASVLLANHLLEQLHGTITTTLGSDPET